jgi:hypothetical protein
MRVLVCGSRDFADHSILGAVMHGLYSDHSMGYLAVHADPEFVVIDGAATGADTMAYEWAVAGGVHPGSRRMAGRAGDEADVVWVETERYPADWNVHDDTPSRNIRVNRNGVEYNVMGGKERNARMLEEGEPVLVVAFLSKPLAESRGTKDMVTRARQAGVKTVLVEVLP